MAKVGIGKTDLSVSTREFVSPEEREVGVNFSQYIVDDPHETEFLRALIREKSPVILQTWEHKPYFCSHCFRLYNRFTYHFLFKDGDFKPDFTCPACGRVLHGLNLEKPIVCPVCREGCMIRQSEEEWT